MSQNCRHDFAVRQLKFRLDWRPVGVGQRVFHRAFDWASIQGPNNDATDFVISGVDAQRVDRVVEHRIDKVELENFLEFFNQFD